jgi:RNA-directed DNA polymerase
MLMERRDQQDLNFTKDTSSIYNNGIRGQKELPARAEELSWKVRISLRGQKRNLPFSNLMKHFNYETLHEAFTALNGKKALGVDGISKSVYAENLEKNLWDLVHRIQSGTYRPLAKREVLIPKPNGKFRPIAIASFEDKLVDWVMGEILTQIYEPTFIPTSFGYRPGKSAEGAIRACYYSMEKNKRPYVLEIDFSSFFNTIPHNKLMSIINKKITDERFNGLIRRLLSGEIMSHEGEVLPSEIGTPQGGIASPILANIYLNEVLDQWFLENWASHNNIIVRYADDGVFFFKEENDCKRFFIELQKRVTKFGLKLNLDKTKTVVLDKKSKEHFHFLGFTFYWGKQGKRVIFKVKTQKEKLHRSIVEFDQWIKGIRNRVKLKVIWLLAKSKIQGHMNYYGFAMNNLKINHFYAEAKKSLFKWLNRRSQILSYTREGFDERLKNFPLVKDFGHFNWKQLGTSFGRI